MDKKYLPIGVDDFKEIIESNYFYVDKTLLIEEILNNHFKVTLLPRPRRFGKTLNMSMLKYFFDIEKSIENRNLFNNLAIEKTKHMEKQGKYPVILISLKDIKTETFEECILEVGKLVKDLYNKKRYIRDKLDPSEQIDFDNVEYLNNSADIVGSLKNLSKYLYKYYNEKVVILIDEYDTPLVVANTQGYYEKAIFFFRNFFSSALKGNEYLMFSVLTGILRVAKESIFSGLNNLNVSTILENEYNHFGLTEEDVNSALKEYELQNELSNVKLWYNGYRFGEEMMYNPWSIINFLKNGKLRPFWINTSDNLLIKGLLEKNDIKVFEDLKSIASGKEIEEIILENIVFSDLDNMETIWSLLFFSGYLTFNGVNISEISGIKTYLLKIPNYEIKSYFRDTFIQVYSNGKTAQYSKMLSHLCNGNIEKFKEIFQGLYFSAVSYHDKGDNEKYYQHFMLGLLLGLGDKYEVTANRESGYGRYDIALVPNDKKNYGLIFEFKIASERDLEIKAKEALEQIFEKEYATSMKRNGVGKIIGIGMAFAGKDVFIKSKIIEN